MLPGSAACTTVRTSGLSMPMPNAIVATIASSSPARNAACTRSRSGPGRPAWYASAGTPAAATAAASCSAGLRVPAPGEELRDAREPQPLGSREGEVELAREVRRGRGAPRLSVAAGVNTLGAEPEGAKLLDLIVHERDERAHDERRAAARHAGQL